MRGLRTSDLFDACRLVKKIGIREEIKEIARQAEENKGKRIKVDFGVDLIFGVIEKATTENSEKDIYDFIANILGCGWEDVRDCDPCELLDKLEQVANFEKWKNFFKRVVDLMKRN